MHLRLINTWNDPGWMAHIHLSVTLAFCQLDWHIEIKLLFSWYFSKNMPFFSFAKSTSRRRQPGFQQRTCTRVWRPRRTPRNQIPRQPLRAMNFHISDPSAKKKFEFKSHKTWESYHLYTGAGKIGSRPLGRAGLEGAPPRVTIKERCTTAGDKLVSFC